MYLLGSSSSSSSMNILVIVSRMASLLLLLKLYNVVLRLLSSSLRVQYIVITSCYRRRRLYSLLRMLIPVKISYVSYAPTVCIGLLRTPYISLCNTNTFLRTVNSIMIILCVEKSLTGANKM